MNGSGAGEEEDYNQPLPSPMCGCCRAAVKIMRPVESSARRTRAQALRMTDRPVWKCECPKGWKIGTCFMCHRCAVHCGCAVPALEVPA